MERTIGELATRSVISVEAETPVIDALKLMSARRISCIIVLHNAVPVGILTERDVVFSANWVIGQPALQVREVMSKSVLTAPAETTVIEAYRLFQEHQLRHLIVLGAQMEADGIFTQTDLVRAFRGMLFPEAPAVSVLMSSKVCQVTSSATARHALALMASHAISGVVVVDGQLPVGIFTERDAVRLVASGVDISTLLVGAVMTTSLVTIPASASSTQAIDLMQCHQVRRLLVLDGAGALAGVLTQSDLSRILENFKGDFADLLTRSHSSNTVGSNLGLN